MKFPTTFLVALFVLLLSLGAGAQSLNITRQQWNTLVSSVSALQTKVNDLSTRVTKLEQNSAASRITALEKQVEMQRLQLNATLVYLREDRCRYAEAINQLATEPSKLSSDPLGRGCPDKSKVALPVPADIPKS